MLVRRQKPEIARPMLEDLATRRQRQAIEGPQAMKEYDGFNNSRVAFVVHLCRKG